MIRLKCSLHTFLGFLFSLSFCFIMPFIDAQSRFPHRIPISVNTDNEQKNQADSFAEVQQRRLTLEKTSIEQNDYTIILIITFNISINPKSISPAAILINRCPLDSTVLIKFNRVGNEVHIFIPIEKIYEIDPDNTRNLLVHIDKITAYDGAKIDERSIENLEFSVTYQEPAE